MTRWYEDDPFWETFAPVLFSEEHWQRSPHEVDAVLALAGTEPGARVLDLGCGPGRHALELARRGFQVTGVDRTASYLAQARERAQAGALELDLVQADMRHFVRPEAFDLAISLYTSFGYFEDPEDDRRVLGHLHESLAPGGTLVMDLMGREILARIFVERSWRELGDGSLILEERRVEGHWSWMENRWILVRDGQRHERRISHRLYAGTELAALLTSVGFSSVQLFGDLAGAPYDQQARRLVAVAHRWRRAA
jgi:SAM-dependent methyltransferase